MELSIELFLLDNLMMDLLMLHLAAAIGALRLRPVAAVAAALGGAVYALLSLTAVPLLRTLPCKLLLCVLASLPLTHGLRELPRALLALFLSACLTGGLLLALTLLLGGTLSGGALVGTVPLRVVLEDRTLELTAFADSGNLLTEPLSGKPVVVVERMLMPLTEGGRPVPYAALGGDGFLYAVQPRLIQVYCGGWYAVDALVAPADVQIMGTQAIIDSALLPKGRRNEDVETHVDVVPAAVPAPDRPAPAADPVHPFGRDAAGAVCTGGGAAVGAAPEGGGEDGGGRADRA